MKALGIILLLLTFHCSATSDKGVVVNIFPDKLVLPINCEAQIRMQRLKSNPENFSIGYSCSSDIHGSFYMDFRLNDTDIGTSFGQDKPETLVKKSEFKSYTLYEITDKDSNDNLVQSTHYCTQLVCLDLVGDYKPSVKADITAQLKR